jgi:hypothetical protein
MVLKLIQSRFKGLNLNTRALEALAQGNSTGQIVGEAIKNRMGMAFVKNLNLGGGRGRFGMSSQGPERPVCKPYPAECPSS